jgi:hypothetical protein
MAEKSLIKTMVDALRGKSNAQEAKDGAEKINAALPDELSARSGVLKRRKRLEAMDAQTAENPTDEQRAAMARALRGED